MSDALESVIGQATELPWLWAGLAAYALATFIAVAGVIRTQGRAVGAMAVSRSHEKLVLMIVATGVVLIAIALAERWVRIGHGPFVNLFELLMSQLFSLGLVFTLVYWRMPVLRPSAVVALPLMGVLGGWVLALQPVDTPLPPTYHNDWLWAHVGLGKIFLSLSLVGTGLAGVILLRHTRFFAGWFRQMPADEVLDGLAWRFMLLAFIFHSLMLIAGAVWAQDAWGRYWAWDALETSSFLNWLLLGASIHARLTYRMPIRVGAMAIIAVFVFAFITYFGTPFYSEAAHKGVI